MFKRNLFSSFAIISIFLIVELIPQQGFSGEPILSSEYIQVINTYKTEKAIFSSPIETYNNNVVVG